MMGLMSIRAVRGQEQEQHEQQEQESGGGPQSQGGRGTQFATQGAIPPVAPDVAAHTGPSASERGYGALGAVAYAQGNTPHTAPGAAAPVAHEAAHVVQQRAGRVAKPVVEDEGLEHEADEMGEKAHR